jgi:hypothetical protein
MLSRKKERAIKLMAGGVNHQGRVQIVLLGTI